jgi:hypothetical protein
MYRPNFCAECGGRIAPKRWRIWTSRRFCSQCAPRFRNSRIVLPLLAALALFGIGLATGRSSRPVAPPLIVERVESAPLPPTTAALKPASSTGKAPDVSDAEAVVKPSPVYGADGTANERPTDPNEVVSICGARTKKGTPCTRRVRGTGRCWQHKGMPAMLPASKLIVKG